MHMLYEVSRGTAPVRIIVHVRDTARLWAQFGYSAIVLRFNVLRILLQNKNFKMDVSATQLFEQSISNFADGYSK